MGTPTRDPSSFEAVLSGSVARLTRRSRGFASRYLRVALIAADRSIMTRCHPRVNR